MQAACRQTSFRCLSVAASGTARHLVCWQPAVVVIIPAMGTAQFPAGACVKHLFVSEQSIVCGPCKSLIETLFAVTAQPCLENHLSTW